MKHYLDKLNKAFDSRVRLALMSVLVANKHMDFTELKDLLQMTDGNLASHLMTLEKAGYIEVRKSFLGRKPLSSYSATAEGRVAFKAHLDALEQLIHDTKPAE